MIAHLSPIIHSHYSALFSPHQTAISLISSIGISLVNYSSLNWMVFFKVNIPFFVTEEFLNKICTFSTYYKSDTYCRRLIHLLYTTSSNIAKFLLILFLYLCKYPILLRTVRFDFFLLKLFHIYLIHAINSYYRMRTWFIHFLFVPFEEAMACTFP